MKPAGIWYFGYSCLSFPGSSFTIYFQYCNSKDKAGRAHHTPNLVESSQLQQSYSTPGTAFTVLLPLNAQKIIFPNTFFTGLLKLKKKKTYKTEDERWKEFYTEQQIANRLGSPLELDVMQSYITDVDSSVSF